MSETEDYEISETVSNISNITEESEDDIIEIIDPATGGVTYNNWSEQNINTVRNWKASVSKASFIYENTLEKYKKRVNWILIMALVFGTINTIIAAVSSALLTTNEAKFKYVALGFNLFIFVVSGIVTILNGIIEITNWDEFTIALSTYIEKLDAFYASIASELVLPPKLRVDAIKFIKKEDSNYLNLMMQAPNIKPSDYKDANNKYDKFAHDSSMSFKCAQKYNLDDSVIDIV